jgi:RNA polymerase sigma factor (sigma-70 family)
VTARPFEEVVAEHGPVVIRVCRAMLGPDDAQDAWSETFVAALRAYPDLRPDSNVRAWLLAIAHNKAIDLIRRRNRAPRPTAELPEIPVLVDPPDTDPALRRALAALPPKQRGAVVFRYLADLPYAEIGVLLESNEAAARRSAADGIAALRTTYLKGSTR